MDFKNIHIDSISNSRLNASNIILRYYGKPLKIKTDIAIFESGIYKDIRGKYKVDVQISSEFHCFLLMLDARLEKYAAKHNLKYLRFVKKGENIITLKIPFNRKFGIKVFKENELGSVEDVEIKEGASLTLTLGNMWILNDDIAGPLITLSEINLAVKLTNGMTDTAEEERTKNLNTD